MERENFYVLLELAPDPPVTDPAVIKTAIQLKRQEWTRQKDDPNKRNEALANLALIPEIQRVLLDGDLQKTEAESAEKQKRDMLRKFEAELRVLEGKGHILPREAAALTVKYRAYGVDREKVIASARCPIDELPPEQAQEAPAGEILDRESARMIQKNLHLLGYEDLYVFLEQPPHASIKKLQAAAEQKRKAAADGQGSAAAIVQELAGISARLFADFDTKQTYDRFLRVGGYPALAEMIDQEQERSGYVSEEIFLRLVNYGVETYRLTVLEAEDAIRRYCAAYSIPLGSKGRQLICPACGSKTDQSGMACSVCAAPLKGECPGCGTSFAHGPAVCSACGFPIADMVKGLQNISEAEIAVIEKNWSTAQRCLQYAKKYWPGHPKIAPLEKRAMNLAQKYDRYMDKVGDCVKQHQYYAARDVIREAAGRRIQLPQATVDQVNQVIEKLEGDIAKLQQGPAEPDFDKVMELAETVSDSMELSRMMRRCPPAPPEKLTAKVSGRKVRLHWGKSASTGMVEYVVVRKQGGTPMTAYDGDVVYQGGGNSCVDLDAPTLSDNYYSVYARRAGTYSETGAEAAPTVIIPEMEELHILPLDGGAQLTWKYNPDVREVVIWRKLGGERPEKQGEGIRLENTRLDGFTDTKIKNGVEYWYYVVAVYVIAGQAVQSHGVCGKAIPHKVLAPIDQMMIARADGSDDEYVVNWQSAGYQDVLLFSAPRKPACRMGDMLPVKDLLANYRKIDLEARQPDSARFRYRWSGGAYLFAAVVSGSFATVGEIKYIANVENVEYPGYDLLGNFLYLTMTWPEDVMEIEVNYRFDRYAAKPGEKGSTVLRCKRGQYDFETGLRIRDPEEALYYITIYSTFVTPEGERIYSKGVELLVNNMARQELYYQFACRKKLFSKKSVVSFAISSTKKFMMPKAVVVGKVGRLPLNKTDGVQLFELDKEVKVEGSMKFDYSTTSLPQDLYLRLFFEDDSQYDLFRPLPAGNSKVT